MEVDETVQAMYRLPNKPIMHTKVRLYGLREGYRRGVKKYFGRPGQACEIPCEVTDAFEASAKDFKENNWVLVENFFASDFHRQFVENWPSRYYFQPARTVVKSYDSGMGWVRGQIDPTVAMNPVVNAAMGYLKSAEFEQRVTAFCGDNIERTNYSGKLDWATAGSSVIPHRDTVAGSEYSGHFLNFVIFVNGTGGPNAGGLCIMDSGKFEDVIFEPQNLVNTVLIYNSGAELWHGFAPMRAGSFRWTMRSQFCGRSWRDAQPWAN